MNGLVVTYLSTNYPRLGLVEKIRYGIGEQDVARYRKWLGADEKLEATDRSLMNIDYRPPDYAKKMLEALHGTIFSQPFNVYLEAVDPLSESEKLKNAFRALTYRDMSLSAFGQQVEQMFGGDLTPADMKEVPVMQGDTGEDMMKAFLSQSNKLPVEIAPKTIMDKVLLVDNKWEGQHRRVGYDIIHTNLPTGTIEYRNGRMIVTRRSPVHGILRPIYSGGFRG